jgi:hypothetical protein
MASEADEWRDSVMGWRFDFRPPPNLAVVGEGPLAPGWRQSVVLLPVEGVLRVAEVKVFPDGDRRAVKSQRDALGVNVHLRMWSESPSALDPNHPQVTGQILRQIHLPDIVTAVRERWAADAGRTDRTAWEELLGAAPGEVAADFIRSVDIERPTLGRTPRDKTKRRDVELAAIAALYDDAVNHRGSRSPIKDISSYLGGRTAGWPESSVRDAKFSAADKGFLAGTVSKRAAGVLTRKAVVVLEEAAKEEAKP